MTGFSPLANKEGFPKNTTNDCDVAVKISKTAAQIASLIREIDIFVKVSSGDANALLNCIISQINGTVTPENRV
jgi:hypothetical protein